MLCRSEVRSTTYAICERRASLLSWGDLVNRVIWHALVRECVHVVALTKNLTPPEDSHLSAVLLLHSIIIVDLLQGHDREGSHQLRVCTTYARRPCSCILSSPGILHTASPTHPIAVRITPTQARQPQSTYLTTGSIQDVPHLTDVLYLQDVSNHVSKSKSSIHTCSMPEQASPEISLLQTYKVVAAASSDWNRAMYARVLQSFRKCATSLKF